MPVTTTVDEENAVQAANLGKSLARVLTMADTIVSLAGDLGEKIRSELETLKMVSFDSSSQIERNKGTTMQKTAESSPAFIGQQRPKDAIEEHFEYEEILKRRNYYKDSIAIVGHSCRFPEANDNDEFWELLIKGGDGIGPPPAERFEMYHLDEKKFGGFKGGFLKSPIDEFDAKFFEISPREAELIDPQQRLLLEVAWEALENAAINPHSLKGSNTGVFTGIWKCDYENLVKENTPTSAFHNIILGNAFSATSARIAYFLGLNGPNIATESGCSSSMVALHLACESLKRKETNLGLVMGANIIDIQEEGVPILATDGHCKTFDEKADGFGRAEGIAVIVLKRLSDAISNGDRVMGIIRGSGMSNEGTSSSFGTPSKLCQEIAVREALKNSGVHPEEVDYVEAHGTGTPVGDPIEFSALSACYAGKREKPLIIASVKTNIGHTESVAGLAGIFKVILSMKHETIPRHINFDTLNPNINLESIPAIVPLDSQPWNRNKERVRIAGVSSFGISGTNVHVILEEPIRDNEYDNIIINNLEEKKSHNILTLSAKTETALEELTCRYSKFLNENSEIDINDLCFTSCNGRAHLKYRAGFIGNNISQLAEGLRNNTLARPVCKETLKIAFLFTGQGSQYLGMGHSLYKSNSVFRSSFEKCAKIIKKETGIVMQDVIWGNIDGSLLNQCVSCQLSIFCVEYALLKLFFSLGVKPDFVLGHSVGEYAAAVASGIIDLEDALILLIRRSQLISELPSGGMMAISCSKEKGQELISTYSENNKEEWIDIAVTNSPEEIVVAGRKESLENFQKICTENKIRFKVLSASHAFHSRDIEEILILFEKVTSKIKYNNPSCQYISGTTGTYLTADEMSDGQYWLRHARYPVNFQTGIKTLVESGCNTFIEIGPRPTLLALGLQSISIENTLWLPSLQQNRDNWEVLLESLRILYLNGANINWSSIYPPENRKKLELPTYPFQRQKYWISIPEKPKSKTIHPLLGKKVSLVTKNETVYTNIVNLKEFSFIKDHQVANHVIMPGAGFLEIICAVGKDLLSQTENNSKPLQVKSFIIESAFELEEGKQYELQVVATPQKDENNSLVVSVHVFNKLNGWKKHAFATLFLGEEKSELTLNSVNIESLKERCGDPKSSNEFYKEVQKSGIHFGEAFQSIESIWSTESEALVSIPIKSLPVSLEEYIFHPIVLDAMLQTVALAMEIKDSSLFLPVAINNCTSFGGNVSDVVYCHARWNATENTGVVTLYNSGNDLLFVMTGVCLMRTTIDSFLNGIGGQKNTLPDLYHEIWRPRLGPLQSRLDLKNLPDLADQVKPLEQAMEKDMEIADHIEHQKLEDEYNYLTLIKMFEENGIHLELGTRYTTNSFMVNHSVSLSHIELFERIIDIFCEEGYLARLENSEEWELIKQFPTHQTLQSELDKSREKMLTKTPVEANIFKKCMENFWNVVTKKVDAVTALFGRSDLNILEMYTKGLNITMANIRMAKFLGQFFGDLKKTPGSVETSIIRIIEIGGGSAATSKEILKVLQLSGVSYQYTFTDISAQFFENAKTELSSFEMVDYKELDIEKDPALQGFCPNHYDIVVAANVIHATEYLRISIGHIRKLLRNNGLLLLQEILRPWRSLDVIFGILDSYWKFRDYDLRTKTPVVSKDVWDGVLTQCDFETSHLLSNEAERSSILVAKAAKPNVHSESSKNKTTSETQNSWLLFCDDGGFHKTISETLSTTFTNILPLKHGQSNPLDLNVINMLDEQLFETNLLKLTESKNISGVVYLTPLNYDNQNTSELYIKTLNFCKYFTKHTPKNARVMVITRGALCVTNQDTVNPFSAVVWGMFKSLINEIPQLTITLIDLDPDDVVTNKNATEIFYEIFQSEENFVCYRKGKKMVPRYVKFSEDNEILRLPKGEYKLKLPKTKRIADLTFKSHTTSSLEPDDVKVIVKAMSLNFRDILVILKAEGYYTLYDDVGTDFAGIVSKIGSNVTKFKPGDEVFGLAIGTAVSHIILKETGWIYHKPSHFSLFEAVTIPSCHLTAHYCLVLIANLKKDETVLIHVASGGVGLYAIQIAQYIGARIVVTAGSHRKRSFLRSLGLQYIFNSRDLSFGEGIKKVTNGLGVDVVLNSLTTEGFKETTLENCAKSARFVEMGKVNIWQLEDVQKLRPDVKYAIFDLEKVDPVDLASGFDIVFNKDIIKPVSHYRFDIRNIRNALNYFMKAQHIGKIVLTMPEISNIGNQLAPQAFVFNKNATYLITGGLGGIGLVVAKWMAGNGAGNLILLGRSPPNDESNKTICKLRSKGCRISTFQVDIGDLKQLTNLFDTILSNTQFPPLKGMIHSAGVLSDATFVNQTWEKYQSVFNAKIQGCLNLHELTKHLQLDYFVMFSSISAVLAPIGQSNHSAANSFLDAFAHYRHSIGLPAQSINWGAWSEVGAAANSKFIGLYPFNPRQGISALQFVMSRPNLQQLGVAQLNVKDCASLAKLSQKYVESSQDKANVAESGNTLHAEKFWKDLKPLKTVDRQIYIKNLLTNLIREILKLPKGEPPNEYQLFSEMGMDSLMSVELKNKLQSLLGDTLILSAVTLVDYPSISKLSEHIAEVTLSTVAVESETNEIEVGRTEEMKLIEVDSILPDDIKGSGNTS